MMNADMFWQAEIPDSFSHLTLAGQQRRELGPEARRLDPFLIREASDCGIMYFLFYY